MINYKNHERGRNMENNYRLHHDIKNPPLGWYFIVTPVSKEATPFQATLCSNSNFINCILGRKGNLLKSQVKQLHVKKLSENCPNLLLILVAGTISHSIADSSSVDADSTLVSTTHLSGQTFWVKVAVNTKWNYHVSQNCKYKESEISVSLSLWHEGR